MPYCKLLFTEKYTSGINNMNRTTFWFYNQIFDIFVYYKITAES